MNSFGTSLTIHTPENKSGIPCFGDACFIVFGLDFQDCSKMANRPFLIFLEQQFRFQFRIIKFELKRFRYSADMTSTIGTKPCLSRVIINKRGAENTASADVHYFIRRVQAFSDEEANQEL